MKASVALALLCAVLLAPLPASADTGFASATVHLRAGPGTHYPIIGVIPRGSRLGILGCLSAYDWCDVTWGRERGWVSGRYLQAAMQARPVPLRRHTPPVTSFDFPRYWSDHYQSRPFYSHRDRYQGYRGPSMGVPGHRTPPSYPDSGPNANDRPCQPGTANCRSGRFN